MDFMGHMKESPSRFQLHWIHPSNNNPSRIRKFNRATNFVINNSVGMLDNMMDSI